MKIHKNMTNMEIAQLLRAIAACYEIKGANKNRFRIIAYENAADAAEHLSSEAKDLWEEGKLSDVSGIGESIEEHLGGIFKTGKSKHFQKVMKDVPPSVFEMIKVSGIGPKTAIKLAKNLKISDKNPLKDLKKKAKKGGIANLEGFGEDSEKSILNSIDEVEGREKRLLLNYAMSLADEITEWMEKSKDVERVDALGSLRRRASTVGDIDMAAATKRPEAVLEHFTNYPKKSRVLEKGERTASIILPGDRQVDMMVETPDAYGALLQHFTGSKHHNIALREYALKKNLSLSDYGIYVKKGSKKKLKKIATEEAFYKFLKMQWIPPELREDNGEIKAALNDELPDLVELKDIKGDLHVHSDFDIETSHDLGESTMKTHVKKASELGYEYLAFTEHNPSQTGHKDKDFVEILKKKKEKIKKINDTLVKAKNIGVKKVFNSLEIDILPDGKIPVPDMAMELLDFALVSIHSSFRQSRKKMTKRVLSALKHPKVKIFAHPTARKLNERESIELDWEKIFEVCKKNNKFLEINTDAKRLDLPDYLVHDAVENGVKMTLGTDSHYVEHMDNMEFGLFVARRGWATKMDIVNTRTFKKFEKMIE